jgi:hypothetical protein
MANINTKLSSEHERYLKAAFDSLITFGKLFLAGDFTKSTTPLFHYEIADELISPSRKPCAIILPRGHAKTTLVKAKIVRDLCFAKKAKEWGFADEEKDLFFGWVSSNQRKSLNNVNYVKLHLEHNEIINFYFGKDGASLRGNVWNQEDLVTSYGDRLVSSSNLTSMRGDTLATIKSGALRYSGVFVDDAENEDNTRTQQSREKIVDNIMNGILPAIEKNQEGCRLFFIGTPVHFDCMIQNVLDKWEKVQKEEQSVMEKFTWKVITYAATQPVMPGGVLWNSYMPRKKLDEIKQTYVDSPRGVEGYYQEYELQVQSMENALWTRKHIKYHDYPYVYRDGQNWLHINGVGIPVNTFVGCDPATDIDTKTSDFSVIMVIAVDDANNIYVLDYERHRSIPTVAARDATGKIIDRMGVVDYIIDMYNKYHCESGTVEDVAMNRTVFQALNDRKRILNDYNISIVGEKPGGTAKVSRIYSGLSSRFANGQIYVRETHIDLTNEIIKFGAKMAHDDTIETLYYACRYAYPPDFRRIDNLTGEMEEAYRPQAKSWATA